MSYQQNFDYPAMEASDLEYVEMSIPSSSSLDANRHHPYARPSNPMSQNQMLDPNVEKQKKIKECENKVASLKERLNNLPTAHYEPKNFNLTGRCSLPWGEVDFGGYKVRLTGSNEDISLFGAKPLKECVETVRINKEIRDLNKKIHDLKYGPGKTLTKNYGKENNTVDSSNSRIKQHLTLIALGESLKLFMDENRHLRNENVCLQEQLNGNVPEVSRKRSTNETEDTNMVQTLCMQVGTLNQKLVEKSKEYDILKNTLASFLDMQKENASLKVDLDVMKQRLTELEKIVQAYNTIPNTGSTSSNAITSDASYASNATTSNASNICSSKHSELPEFLQNMSHEELHNFLRENTVVQTPHGTIQLKNISPLSEFYAQNFPQTSQLNELDQTDVSTLLENSVMPAEGEGDGINPNSTRSPEDYEEPKTYTEL